MSPAHGGRCPAPPGGGARAQRARGTAPSVFSIPERSDHRPRRGDTSARNDGGEELPGESDTDDDTFDDDFEPPEDEGDEYDATGWNPDSETDSIAGDDERDFDSDEEVFGVGGGVGDGPGLRTAGDPGDPGVAETPPAPTPAPLLLPPPPPPPPPPRGPAEGGAGGAAGLGIPETMGVSGRAPRKVRSVYATANVTDAKTARREGETDAVVPAGGTAEPSGDRRRGDGATTKRRRVDTEIADPEPRLGCPKCRQAPKGCKKCRTKHAEWVERNGVAGDGTEPERAPSDADDDRDEGRDSQRGDADAAHDPVDGGDGDVAVAAAAVAAAGLSRGAPAQLPDRPRMYGEGAYALLPTVRGSFLPVRARQLLVEEGRSIQGVADEIDVKELFASVPGVDEKGRGFFKNVYNALRILAQEYGIALITVGPDKDKHDPDAPVPPPPPAGPGTGGGGGALRARARGADHAIAGAATAPQRRQLKQHATWLPNDEDGDRVPPIVAEEFQGDEPGCKRNASARRQTPVLPPFEYWSMLITEKMLDDILVDSNRYRHEVLSKPRPVALREGVAWPATWAVRGKDRTIADLKKFLGVLYGLAAGRRNRTAMRDMLSTHSSAWSSQVPWLRKVGVTETWFSGWVQQLHCQPETWKDVHGGGGRRVGNRAHLARRAGAFQAVSDNRERGAGDGAAGSGVAGMVDDDAIPHNHRTPKLGRLLEDLHRNCMQCYSLRRDVSLDEQTATSDSRSNPLRHLQPHKPSNGIRIYAVCDLSGYCWTFRVDLREPGVTIESMVFALCVVLPRVFHRVYMDNLFTSVVVLQQLREWNILGAGTARATGGFPRELNPKFSPAANFNKSTDRGKWLWRRALEGILAVVWCDCGIVKFLSNFHMPVAATALRRVPGHKERMVVPCATVTNDYNQFMGGNDISDQLRFYQTTQRKSAKWWHALFYWCLDVTLVNAYVMYKSDFERACREDPERWKKKDMLKRAAFTTSIAEALMGIDDTRQLVDMDVAGSVTRRNSARTASRTFACNAPMPEPVGSNAKKNCKLCYARWKVERKATVKCLCCGVHFCLNVKRNCFREWHERRGGGGMQNDEPSVNLDAAGRYESG